MLTFVSIRQCNSCQSKQEARTGMLTPGPASAVTEREMTEGSRLLSVARIRSSAAAIFRALLLLRWRLTLLLRRSRARRLYRTSLLDRTRWLRSVELLTRLLDRTRLELPRLLDPRLFDGPRLELRRLGLPGLFDGPRLRE